MRGARTGKDPAPHLLAVLDQATGTVLAQARVADKSNEIPALRELLKPLDLDGVVVSADAMHTQTDTAEWITQQGGHYVITPLGNQKTLRRTLKKLPFKDVPSTSSVDISHGRRGQHTIKAVEAPTWAVFLGAAQVVQVRRTRASRQAACLANHLNRLCRPLVRVVVWGVVESLLSLEWWRSWFRGILVL